MNYCPRCDSPTTRHSDAYGCRNCGLFKDKDYTYIHTDKYLAYIYNTGITMIVSRETGYILTKIPKAIGVKSTNEYIDKLLLLA